MNSPQEVSKIVVRLAAEKGVSVNRALEESGAGGSFVKNLRKGQIPASNNIVKIADYFNVTTDYLLKGTEPKNTKAEKENVQMNEKARNALKKLHGLFEIQRSHTKEMSNEEFKAKYGYEKETLEQWFRSDFSTPPEKEQLLVICRETEERSRVEEELHGYYEAAEDYGYYSTEYQDGGVLKEDANDETEISS